MRTLLVFSMCVGLVAAINAQTSLPAKQEGPIWFWSSKPGASPIKLEVFLDQKVIFSSTFYLGRLARPEAEKSYAGKGFSFSFKAGRPIKWVGYREDEPISRADQDIECDIQMVGADPGDLILGVVFSRPDTILMNTVHITLPLEKSSSEVEDGLVIVTTPISKAEVSNQSSEPTLASVTSPAVQEPRLP